MKIDLTKNQYWNLMRAVYMADWIANAICDSGMKEDDQIKDIRDYIFSFAKEMGFEKFVEYNAEFDKYYATFEFDNENSTRKLIERYDEHTSWDEISGWLGERDFFRKYSRDEIKRMSDDDRFMKRMECEIVWEKEFEKHGIERLKVDGV